MTNKEWSFVHNLASDAKWTPGLRENFDYRDLGIKDGTRGDYIAHIIRSNGKKQKDSVQHWHIHECTFQFVLVLNGWATFDYEGQGVHTIRKGDAILHPPMISAIVSAPAIQFRNFFFGHRWLRHAIAAVALARLKYGPPLEVAAAAHRLVVLLNHVAEGPAFH